MRHQEVRVHAPYLAYLLAFVFQQLGWHAISRTTTHDGRRFLDAALALASQVLHTNCVVIVRACEGIIAMPVFAKHVDGEVLMWRRGAGAGGVMQFAPDGKRF